MACLGGTVMRSCNYDMIRLLWYIRCSCFLLVASLRGWLLWRHHHRATVMMMQSPLIKGMESQSSAQIHQRIVTVALMLIYTWHAVIKFSFHLHWLRLDVLIYFLIEFGRRGLLDEKITCSYFRQGLKFNSILHLEFIGIDTAAKNNYTTCLDLLHSALFIKRPTRHHSWIDCTSKQKLFTAIFS